MRDDSRSENRGFYMSQEAADERTTVKMIWALCPDATWNMPHDANIQIMIIIYSLSILSGFPPKMEWKPSIIFFWNFFFGGILLLFGGWCREVVYLDWAVDKIRLHRITCGDARLGFLNPFLNLDHLEWFPAVNSGGEGWSGWPMDVANFLLDFRIIILYKN